MVGACLQEDRLWITDPKAINHILQKSGYLYAKLAGLQEGMGLVTGRGLLWAGGKFSSMVSTFWLQPCLTIPQVTCTSATGGQWLQRLA